MIKTVCQFELADLASCHWIDMDWRESIAPIVLQRSQAWTARIDDEVVGIAGITAIYPGSGELWTYFSPGFLKCPVFLHKAGKTVVDLLQNYYRIQTLTRANHKAGCAWVERLGFKLESEMPLAGPNRETMLRYVRFPQGVHRG